ncbi:MAG: cysteine peptidase family C39 domain-containing protein [Candidatus Taylorbacteria bacterium]
MKISPLKQRDESACGPTTIEMVLKYFNIKHSYKEIATVSKYKEEEGFSNTDIVYTLKKFDLNVKEKINTQWSDLAFYNKKNNVIILSWMLDGYIGHVSVLEKITKSHIYLADPHTGTTKKIQKIVFMRLWMDYDGMWYPVKNTDIQLRWMCVASKKKTRSR